MPFPFGVLRFLVLFLACLSFYSTEIAESDCVRDAMDKPDVVEKEHSEGDRTPVRDDSSLERGAKVHHEDALQDISDPDAGKSDEERAEIVRNFSPLAHRTLLTCRTPGQEAPTKTGHETNPLAYPPLPHLLPRQNEHRQRQNRWPNPRSQNVSRPIPGLSLHLLRFILTLRTTHQYPTQEVPS